MTRNGKRGPADHETPPDQTAPSKGDRRKGIPKARAIGLRPAGVRKYWCFIVARCPYCHGPHVHRGGKKGGERRAGCRRGRYWVGAK